MTTTNGIGRLIEAIIELNPTASIEFLRRFRDVELEQYLAHLQHGLGPRGDAWRRLDGPSMVTRRPAA